MTAHDARGVLVMAVQDLSDGENALIERLPKIGKGATDAALKAIIDADRDHSRDQAERLTDIAVALGVAAEGEDNIWLRAILEDAENDIASIAAGPARDVALVGALRKAKQAERVSYETAIALAGVVGMSEGAAELTRSRDEERNADAALAALLDRLAAAA